MLQRKIILFASLFFLFASCSTVVFDQSQPQNVEIPNQNPENLWGIYKLGENDSLIISANKCLMRGYILKSIGENELKKSKRYELKNGLIYDLKENPNKGYNAEIKIESIQIARPKEADTELEIKDEKTQETRIYYSIPDDKYLFVSDTFFIKEFQNQYFVNIKEKEFWSVFMVSQLKNKDLILKMPFHSDEEFEIILPKLQAITNLEEIKDQTYLAKPTEKEFLKMIEAGLFDENEPDTLERIGK